MKPAPQRSRQLGPGDTLGKYQVIRQIAIGGMAELYLARTSGIEGFEKLVVVKRILPQYVSNAAFIDMFLNEARIAATLHHANIAQVYDIGVEEGDYFFAMEYVHGEDLDHISMGAEEQGVPISLDACLTLVAGLCAGLHYAHEKANLVHRDVSPSNVLVSYDGSVKLVDFGIARAATRPGSSTTQGGGIKGKIAYMSPEQCTAKARLDRRSDIYAVGTILYELSTGQLPFAGETEYQILNQIVNDDAPPPSAIVPSYPAALERIVLRALARDPNERYPTALALQTDVEDFAHEMRLRISPLVLARLMGTLFPARLEEWDHAKTQGAFFVEQHVVRTLIESGKTPDPEANAEIQAAIAAREAAEQLAEEQARDEDAETTAVSHVVDDDDTTIGAPAFDAQPTAQLPAAHVPATRVPTAKGFAAQMSDELAVVRAPPEPRRPTPYPHVSDLLEAVPGSLVTSTTKHGTSVEKIGTPGDETQIVPASARKRATSPTTFVRTPNRVSYLIIGGALAVTGAVGAFLYFSRAPEVAPVPEPAAAPAPEPPKPTVLPLESTQPPEAQKSEVAAPEPAKLEPPKPELAKPESPKPPPKPKTIEAKKKIETKSKRAEPKPKKEPTWDVDSPFMPVRTEKH